MAALLVPFLILALIGLFLSVISHLAALLGWPLPLGDASWVLHIGIFVVWLPAVLCSQRLCKDFKQKDMWKATLRGCPPWMRYAAFGIFAYALVNFFVFIINSPGKGASKTNGMPPEIVRGFSGHWMVFYAMAAAILYSTLQVAKHDPARRCQNGHPVNPSASFCESCGAPVPDDGMSGPKG